MRPPLEYGDNFPTLTQWDPTVPWRFPQQRVQGKRSFGSFWEILPWIVFGVGLTVGILWMSWHVTDLAGGGEPRGISPSQARDAEILLPLPKQGVPPAAPSSNNSGGVKQPARTRSRFA